MFYLSRVTATLSIDYLLASSIAKDMIITAHDQKQTDVRNKID